MKLIELKSAITTGDKCWHRQAILESFVCRFFIFFSLFFQVFRERKLKGESNAIFQVLFVSRKNLDSTFHVFLPRLAVGATCVS